jgi:hypothetical protein
MGWGCCSGDPMGNDPDEHIQTGGEHEGDSGRPAR